MTIIKFADSKILNIPMQDGTKPTFHVLNGDGLSEVFPFINSAQIIIMRECLIDGPIESVELALFYRLRAEYLYSTYGAERSEYADRVVSELDKLQHLPEGAKVFLWFEDDLFCQINMWFIVYLLHTTGFQGEIYRVFPLGETLENNWQGFGPASSDDLTISHQNAVRISLAEQIVILQLWTALQHQDLGRLAQLAHQSMVAVRHLPQVIDAYADRFTSPPRPERCLREIQSRGILDFNAIYEYFKQTEAIYGFGDAQVKTMLDRING